MSSWVDVTAASNNQSIFKNTESYEEKSVLGKDDFLKILITQLSNQDPSNPLQDQDFIAQMATFSSLEQMTNLNTSFEKFASQQMSQYASSIGKEISWTQTDSEETLTGIVEGVSTQDGSYFYMVGNEKIPVENVTQIKQEAEETK